MITDKFVLGFYNTGLGRKGMHVFAILHVSAGVVLDQVTKANSDFAIEIRLVEGHKHIYQLKDSLSDEIIGYAIGEHTTKEELSGFLDQIKTRRGKFFLHIDRNYANQAQREEIMKHPLWPVMETWLERH